MSSQPLTPLRSRRVPTAARSFLAGPASVLRLPPPSGRPPAAPRPAGRALRVALVGNHPPRRCGLATYTRDVAAALRGAGHAVHVTAMTDPGAAYDYGEAVDRAVDQGSRADHAAAGRAIAAWRPDVVLVEHEFGIFGGPAGLWIADLLDAAGAPVAATLHTVLEAMTPEQATASAAIEARASALVVMAERGRAILAARDPSLRGRVHVVPHGAPDRPLAEPSEMRARLGWTERPTALTFGLLGPGKGIERMIEALPAILARAPGARYVVMGATHPHVAAREGEALRLRLRERAVALGVEHALRMIPRFVDDDALCDALQAADVYVTPYQNEAQITSGTLAYAFACGLPVVSTPYWHARELLPAGQLVPFDDPAALADAVARLLADPEERRAVARATWRRGRETVWAVHAERLSAALREALAAAAPLGAAS